MKKKAVPPKDGPGKRSEGEVGANQNNSGQAPTDLSKQQGSYSIKASSYNINTPAISLPTMRIDTVQVPLGEDAKLMIERPPNRKGIRETEGGVTQDGKGSSGDDAAATTTNILPTLEPPPGTPPITIAAASRLEPDTSLPPIRDSDTTSDSAPTEGLKISSDMAEKNLMFNLIMVQDRLKNVEAALKVSEDRRKHVEDKLSHMDVSVLAADLQAEKMKNSVLTEQFNAEIIARIKDAAKKEEDLKRRVRDLESLSNRRECEIEELKAVAVVKENLSTSNAEVEALTNALKLEKARTKELITEFASEKQEWQKMSANAAQTVMKSMENDDIIREGKIALDNIRKERENRDNLACELKRSDDRLDGMLEQLEFMMIAMREENKKVNKYKRQVQTMEHDLETALNSASSYAKKSEASDKVVLHLKKQNQMLIGQLKIADSRYRDVTDREMKLYEEMNALSTLPFQSAEKQNLFFDEEETKSVSSAYSRKSKQTTTKTPRRGERGEGKGDARGKAAAIDKRGGGAASTQKKGISLPSLH
jgi:hypothetical protein